MYIELKNLHLILRYIRVFNDVKQKDLSKDIGISSNAISLMESSLRPVSMNHLSGYAERFNLKISSIILMAEDLEVYSDPTKEDVIRSVTKFIDIDGF